jgi:hypothetical protein
MTLQMLPIAQIGSMLSSNQWTEELPHSHSEAGKDDCAVYTPFIPPLVHHHTSIFSEGKALAYIHTSASIPSNHSTDVVTPPPDLS